MSSKESNLNATEQDFITRVKLDHAYTKNQLKQIQTELQQKNELIQKKEIQIKNLEDKLKEIMEAYKTKEVEYKERVEKLQELIEPAEQEVDNNFAKILNKIGVKVTVLE
ncbi:hypothetical protein KA977_00995 [Candidatus Dependentiae bacterium]|nr:hypothetical protein [Candidatus Dependentiae bacterium]